MADDVLRGARVLVVGFGRQGQALARWLPSVGARAVVTDRKTPEELNVDLADFPRVQFALGMAAETELLKVMDYIDVVCVSGGVPLSAPLVQAARERRIPCTNDAQLFIERCRAPVIGITGSAGKTTTTTLVGAMLRHAGITTWVGGNIGSPLIDVMMGVMPQHRVVLELSSFQLELMHTSPQIAAVLNITPNHLDRHGNMQHYMAAKANIIAHQGAHDVAILGFDDGGSHMLEQIVSGTLGWFSANNMVADGAFLIGGRIVVTGVSSPDENVHTVCDVDEIPLRGTHNVSNVLAACAIAGAAGVPPEAMAATIRTFQGVPHRLETVRVCNGITYVNDSIATAPERVLAALRSYDEPLVLLLGGADKKLPWAEMLQLAYQKSRHIVAFGGSAGDLVEQTMKNFQGGAGRFTRVKTLDEAVHRANEVAKPGDVVLFSPGGTSYDAYQDFAARGEHFRQLVSAL